MALHDHEAFQIGGVKPENSQIVRAGRGLVQGIDENQTTMVTRAFLTVQVPDGLPSVSADPQELTMALNHLLDNAIKSTPAGGAVAVSARAATCADGQPGVEIAVQDTRIGIPADQHERIFERFYQADSSLTRQYGGVGIGLAVVKQTIEAHGSHVVVESEPAKSSTFRFTLPLVG